MEFLFDQKYYRRNPLTKDFNSQYIVRLKKNYRSHEKILQIANELYYDNILQAKASSGWHYFLIRSFLRFDIFHISNFLDQTDLFIGNELLPNSGFPVIFDAIRGECQPDQKSWFNSEELSAVVKYVKLILNAKCGKQIKCNDIGMNLFCNMV